MSTARFLLLLSLAFAASVTTASQTSDDYASCLCWDESARDSCQGSEEACNRLATDPTVVPYLLGVGCIMLAALFFFFFPCFFAAGRCCNCCGGREPSYGCCCPYKRLGMTRLYSRGTVNAARFMALVVLLATLASGVMFQFAFRHTADTLESIGNLAGDIEDDVLQLKAQAQWASEVLAVYGIATIDFGFDDSLILTPLQNIQTAMNTSTLPSVRNTQYAAYSLALFGLIGLILALCGARGCFVTSFAMFMSFLAFIALTMLFAFATGAVATEFACSPDYAPATQAYINSSLLINYASRHVAAAVSLAENSTLQYICDVAGFSSLCESGTVYCATNPCFGTSETAELSLLSINATVNANSTFSIAACAQDSNCPLSGQTQAFMADFNAIFPAVSSIFGTSNKNVVLAITGTMGVKIFNLLCTNVHSAKSSLNQLTYAGLAASGALILALIVYVRGAKRFHHGPSPAGGQPMMMFTGYTPIGGEAVSVQQGPAAYWGAPTTVEATPILAGQQYEQYAAPATGKTGSDFA